MNRAHVRYVLPRELPLGERERQVLQLAAQGNQNKMIAQLLGTKKQTVKNQISAALRKLNAVNRAHAVYIAVKQGLIE